MSDRNNDLNNILKNEVEKLLEFIKERRNPTTCRREFRPTNHIHTRQFRQISHPYMGGFIRIQRREIFKFASEIQKKNIESEFQLDITRENGFNVPKKTVNENNQSIDKVSDQNFLLT